MSLLRSLATFLDEEARVRPGDGIVVAFSGGADSTALLYGLTRVAPVSASTLHAAHLDHALDDGRRSAPTAAARAAARLGVACSVERRPVPVNRRGGSGLEAEARRVRYEFFDDVRRELGLPLRRHRAPPRRPGRDRAVARRLRIDAPRAGGIERRRGTILRPLLDCGRDELRAELVAAGIDWIEDPTNRDLARPRNRIRRRLASPPATRARGSPGSRRSRTARGARAAADRVLWQAIEARREFDGASASLSAMRGLP